MTQVYIPRYRLLDEPPEKPHYVYIVEIVDSGKVHKVEKRYSAFHCLHRELPAQGAREAKADPGAVSTGHVEVWTQPGAGVCFPRNTEAQAGVEVRLVLKETNSHSYVYRRNIMNGERRGGIVGQNTSTSSGKIPLKMKVIPNGEFRAASSCDAGSHTLWRGQLMLAKGQETLGEVLPNYPVMKGSLTSRGWFLCLHTWLHLEGMSVKLVRAALGVGDDCSSLLAELSADYATQYCAEIIPVEQVFEHQPIYMYKKDPYLDGGVSTNLPDVVTQGVLSGLYGSLK
uniref:PX domain-containing protein n=1 Tax=Timema poppense TaxID=170557 RepID=A0A7R9CUH2_TIMPO|nr:unnamed protein product [Timema poppensis]